MLAKSNVVLIGMPGSGKSTVGVVLAKRLGLSFVDADLVIQRQTGKRLPELIDELGVDGFLQLENQTVAGIEADGAVIAPGGSVIYGQQAMTHLSTIGHIVYLELSLRAIQRRVGPLADRGVALRAGQKLADLYAERAPLYRRWAEITVSCDGVKLRHVVNRVAKAVKAL